MTTRVRYSAGVGIFSLLYRMQTGSGAHSASYPMDTEIRLPEREGGLIST